MSRRVSLLLPAAGLVLAVAPALGATHDVPGDFATVEVAVADASVAAGDTIRIAPGTYEVQVSVTKALTFVGADPGQATILTGGDTHRVFEEVTADVTLRNLVIESAGSPAIYPSAGYEGGAMRVSMPCEIVIEDCTFRGNHAGRGSAIASYGNVTVRNSLFELNQHPHPTPGSDIYGGAILTWIGTELLVEDCVFRDNRAGSGGAIAALGSAVIRRSVFDDNFAHANGGGAWIASNSAFVTALIEDCEFTGNWSSQGGGMDLATTGEMTVRRCVFRNNTGGQTGGGFAAAKDGPLLVEACEFIDNEVIGQGGAGMFVGYVTNGVTIRESFFRGNEVVEVQPLNAGGALWLLENSNNAEIVVEDCTFVENRAIKGSVLQVQDTGSGPFNPRVERCIFANNTGTLYSCGFIGPNGQVQATVFTDCTLIFDNAPNDNLCSQQGPDIFIPGPDDTQVFCADYSGICDDSLAATTACGLLGGLDTCGSCATPIESTSWGGVKARFDTTARGKAR